MILGDEMGLGKTIQIISLLSAIFNKTGKRGADMAALRDRVETWEEEKEKDEKERRYHDPVLICAPSSVVYQWAREIETWGFFSCSTVKGGGDLDKALGEAASGRAEIVVLSPSTLSTHSEKITWLNTGKGAGKGTGKGGAKVKRDWFLGVFDEAHQFKNAKTKGTQAVRNLQVRTEGGGKREGGGEEREIERERARSRIRWWFVVTYGVVVVVKHVVRVY